MKMNKLISILVIAAILLSAIPMVLAPSTTINITPTYGPVGTKVIVSGTLATYGGRFQIKYDQNADNTTETTLYSGTATGYSYSQEVTIPDSFAGGRYIEVVDLDSDGIPTVHDWFTVQTTATLVASATQVVEGGPITLKGKITGAPSSYNGQPWNISVKSPAGTWENRTGTISIDITYGNWSVSEIYSGVYLGELGVYNAYLLKNTTIIASTSFTVALLSKSQYMRTETMVFATYVPSGVNFDYYEVVRSDGVVIRLTTITGEAPRSGSWYIPKDAPLGIYTLNLHNASNGNFKSATFEVIPASITVRGSINLPFYNASVMRTESQLVNVSLEYPDHTYVLAGDLGGPPTLGVFYNTTQFATLVLDGYAQSPYPVWYGVYKFPKNAPIGIGWGFNVTKDSLTDRYGNKGPAAYVSTGGIITVNYAQLKLDNWDTINAPSLVYPPAGGSIQRTLTSSATFRIIYPDTTLYTPSDLGTAKIRAVYGEGGNYSVSISAADYNSTSGAWLAKWKIPYDAPTTIYRYDFYSSDVVDAYGNFLPPTSESSTFNVVTAEIKVTDLATNKPEYMSDDDLIVSFRALYPSGDPVINLHDLWLEATNYGEVIPVHFYGTNGEVVGEIFTKYNPSTQKYSGTWIVASGYASGTWNATVFDEAVVDDAHNVGPTTDVWTNFNVVRLSLTDIWKYLHEMNATFIQCCTQAKEAIAAVQTTANNAVTEAQAAKAAAQAASTAATAAKTAADEAKASAATAITSANAAKTAADAAKTAADGAGTKADAAKTAADAAKAAAQAATDANNSQTTLIYAAIGAALVAAIAAIVALMQISRKIA